MSISEFSCPSCNAQYRVPAKAGGKQATCKSCGKKITVPSGSGSSGSGSRGGSGGGSGSSRNVNLSGLYNSAEAGGADPVFAPPMEGGSVFATSTPRRSGPSPVLLIGLGGGAVVLILAVVLVIVLTSGGGGDTSDPAQAAGPTVVDTRPMRPRGGDRTDNDPAGGGTEVDSRPTPPVAANPGRLIDPPGEELEGVMDWSLPVPEKVATYAERVELRGLVLTLPPGWEYEVEEHGEAMADDDLMRDVMVRAYGAQVSEGVTLSAGPADEATDVSFAMTVTRNTDLVGWPTLREIEEVTRATLGIDGVDVEAERASPTPPDPEVAAAFGTLNAMTHMMGDQAVAFNLFAPETYYLKRGAYDEVTYGTLFGGHPFARVVLRNTAEDTQTLLYVGTIGHLQVTMVGQASAQAPVLLDDLDWVFRSAQLMTTAQAREYARGDAIYSGWIDNSFVDVAYAGDNVPHAELDQPGWDGFSEQSLFQNAAAASMVTPHRQPYGLIAPEGMRLATTNRVAARWSADENGMWLQMKVTKLAGRAQRTMESPVLPAEGGGERLFIYSSAVPLPEGYEVGELEADGFTLQRVLLPAVQGQDVRKVYYILFDGPDQVTIEGHFDKNRPEDLERLDAAAQTLTKI